MLASLVLPLGYLFCPLCPPPVVFFGDIWDVPSLEEEEGEEGEEDEEDKNDNVPTSRPRYIIEFDMQCLIAIANTIV